MKFKTNLTLLILILTVSLLGAFQVMPGGPKYPKGLSKNSNIQSCNHHRPGSPALAPFPIDYQSYFYTFYEARIFA